MNNKGCLPTVIGSLIIVAIIIWLFKILVILGIIGSIITAVYFGYFAYKQPNNRKRLLKRRVLPALIQLSVEVLSVYPVTAILQVYLIQLVLLQRLLAMIHEKILVHLMM